MQFECTLQRWCGWHSHLTPTPTMWPGGQLLANVDGSADVQFLPMLQRRRLSPLGRIVSAVVWHALLEQPAMPSVFYSRHGESRYSFEILEALAEHSPLSPHQFSLCVHNAIAGQMHMQQQNRQPYIALAGGSDGLGAALLEVQGLLQQQSQVLLVAYDQPLPQLYQALQPHSDRMWALAMVFGRAAASPGMAINWQRCLDDQTTNQAGREDALLQAMLEGATQGELIYPAVRWQWHASLAG